MATIEYRVGDFLEGPERLVAHGCNARGAFGKGVAAHVRLRCPEAYDAYIREHRGPGLKVGTVVLAESGRHLVANCITQQTYGRRGRHVDYEAVRTCMRRLNELTAEAGPSRAVAMPLIGAGLGGGEWGILAAIIESELNDLIPVVYTLDGRIPA